jgi:hypothetical protein
MQRTQSRTVCERLEWRLPNENCSRGAMRAAIFHRWLEAFPSYMRNPSLLTDRRGTKPALLRSPRWEMQPAARKAQRKSHAGCVTIANAMSDAAAQG